MNVVGINDGDLLVVDRSLNPKNFSTVVANVNEELVVKTFIKEKNRSFLTSGSKKLKDKINIPESGISPITTSNDDEEIISALAVLGYSRTEVTTILGSLVFEKEAVSLEDKIKLVLGQMA